MSCKRGTPVACNPTPLPRNQHRVTPQPETPNLYYLPLKPYPSTSNPHPAIRGRVAAETLCPVNYCALLRVGFATRVVAGTLGGWALLAFYFFVRVRMYRLLFYLSLLVDVVIIMASVSVW